MSTTIISQLQAIQEAAWTRIHSADLDDVVREIAKAGKYDGTANWLNDWDDRQFACTEGAGENSARVSAGVDGMLYHVAHYGQYLRVFRDGPWVTRAVSYASQLRRAQKATEAETRNEQLRAELANFQRYEG